MALGAFARYSVKTWQTRYRERNVHQPLEVPIINWLFVQAVPAVTSLKRPEASEAGKKGWVAVGLDCHIRWPYFEIKPFNRWRKWDLAFPIGCRLRPRFAVFRQQPFRSVGSNHG